MCYYSFVRYLCGCAPLDPVLLHCLRVCSSPRTDYTSHKYLSYNCNNCQHTRDLNGRSRQDLTPLLHAGPAVRGIPPRDPERRGRGMGQTYVNSSGERVHRLVSTRTKDSMPDPENFVETENGTWRKVTWKEKKEEERITQRAERAEAARQRQRERGREEKEEEDRRKAARKGDRGRKSVVRREFEWRENKL